MSTDKDKPGTGGGDSPVLLGSSTDPKISARIDALTREALDGAIARLDAAASGLFGEDEEDTLFPDEIPTVAAAEELGDQEASGVTEPAAEEEDGLDRILDTLSNAPDAGDDPELPEGDLESEHDDPRAEPEVRSMRDLVLMQEEETAAPVSQRSPIADVLAGSGGDQEEAPLGGYRDPGVPDPDDASAEEASYEDDLYDPMGDLDAYLGEEEPAEAPVEDHDPDFPDEDPDFPEDEMDLPEEGYDLPEDALDLPDDGEPHGADDAAGAESDRSYALPEPSPYGDEDMMGGAYSYDEDEAEDLPEPIGDEAEADEDPLEGWSESEGADWEPEEEPVQASHEARPDPREAERGQAASQGSALDDLLTGLTPNGEAEPDLSDEETAPAAPERADADRIPAFLGRDESGKLLCGVLSGAAPERQDEVTGTEETSMRDGDVMDEPVAEEPFGDDAPNGADTESDTETEDRPARTGRKRMLAGVAALALLAAAGAGAYLMLPGLLEPARVAEAPAGALMPAPPVEDFAPVEGLTPVEAPVAPIPGPVLAETPEVVEPEADVTAPEDLAGLEPEPEAEPEASAPPEAPVSDELSALMAELNREPEAPVVVGASPEELAALEERVVLMERARSDAKERAAQLTDELTSLTDQITGLLQRDSEQAERLERMERLIRGQSAIMAQFGEMEESLEQTQVVLLDVSARIGAVEGQNPADRDAVNRALADVEERIQALTANMSILARMSIEGVDALRAPNASSGTVGVQTAPAAEQAAGGADPVFRSETGGFRISSDPAGRVPAGVAKDDFVEGYGYVLDVLPASDGQRLVIMENGSVLVPSAD
jgi:hypothetical protein